MNDDLNWQGQLVLENKRLRAVVKELSERECENYMLRCGDCLVCDAREALEGK